ncbi:hypothetical protein D3C71_2195840 [compost metagenome]
MPVVRCALVFVVSKWKGMQVPGPLVGGCSNTALPLDSGTAKRSPKPRTPRSVPK